MVIQNKIRTFVIEIKQTQSHDERRFYTKGDICAWRYIRLQPGSRYI